MKIISFIVLLISFTNLMCLPEKDDKPAKKKSRSEQQLPQDQNSRARLEDEDPHFGFVHIDPSQQLQLPSSRSNQ